MTYWIQKNTKILDLFTKAYHLDDKIHFPPDYLENMSNFEASVGLVQLKKYPQIIKYRINMANNYSKNFIRAWHGHLIEEKYIKCLSGTFQVSAVKIGNIKKPNKKNKIFNYFLNETNDDFIHIPKGYANGSMSLEENSKLLILSTLTVRQSEKDDYRFDSRYWNPWKINER